MAENAAEMHAVLDGMALWALSQRYEEMVAAGFQKEMLTASHHKVAEYIERHFREMVPERIDGVLKVRPPLEADLLAVSNGRALHQTNNVLPSLIVEQLRARILSEQLRNGVLGATRKLTTNDPHGAWQVLIELVERVKVELSADKSHNAFSDDEIDATLKHIEKAALGTDGLDTPWPTFNELTKGMLPMESTWFCARPAVGKTWVATVLVFVLWSYRFAAEYGKAPRIMVVSPELKRRSYLERLFSIATRITFIGMVRGLGDQHMEILRERMAMLRGQSDFWIMDEDDGLNEANIEAEILRRQPDILLIDSVYEIQWYKGLKTPAEKLAAGAAIIRKWTRRAWPTKEENPLWPDDEVKGRKLLAIIATSQLNRVGVVPDKKKDGGGGGGGGGKGGYKGKGGGRGREEGAGAAEEEEDVSELEARIGMSDYLTQSADRLFIMSATREQRENRQLTLHAVKVRRRAGSSHVSKFTIRCDQDTMDFSEVENSHQSQGGYVDQGPPT